jgi:hypothetical protein
VLRKNFNQDMTQNIAFHFASLEVSKIGMVIYLDETKEAFNK